MKNFIFVSLLVFVPSGFAKSKLPGSQKQPAETATAQKAAEAIVRSLYGTNKDPIRTDVLSEKSFRVTIGDGSSQSGAASYLVEFSTLKLKALSEDEVSANMKITYEGGN